MDDLVFSGPTAKEMDDDMAAGDLVIAKAEREYERLGVIKTSTFCELTEHGIDAQAILNNLETENHG